jgi:nucleotide-binding universal stress UspA family protein
MYTVVAGVDESIERGQSIATTISGMPIDVSEVTVILLHDFADNPEGASVGQVASVRRASNILEDAGFEVELAESSGDPAEEILSLADEEDADQIVVAGRKRNPTGKVLFGSVTQDVVLGTDRPVLVCGDEALDN